MKKLTTFEFEINQLNTITNTNEISLYIVQVRFYLQHN